MVQSVQSYFSFWTNSTFVRLGQGIIPMLFGTPWEFISAPGPWISERVMDGLCCKAIHYVYYPSGPKMGSAARLNWVQTHGLPWRVLHCVWDWVRTVPRGRSWVWELYRIGGAARRVSESQLPDLQHPTKNWQQKQIRSYAFFILFILFLCLICCKSQLRTKPPSRKAAASILRVVVCFMSTTVPLRHTFVSASRCRKSPIMLHRVVFLF